MPDPDGIQLTEFGGPNEEARYADSNSAKGIGFREGYTMQKDIDVALNSQARAKFGITAYDPSRPETANQWFTYGGKRYHYADNVPEIYNNARIDVFKGTYDYSRGRNVIGWKPANIDTNHNSTSLLTQFREQYPEYKIYSNQAVLESLKKQMAPGMDSQHWQSAATSPNGGADVMAYFKTPLYQLRQDAGEEGKGKTDEQILRHAYDYNVSSGKINKDTESFDDFKERFAPSQTWQAQTGRFVKQVQNLVVSQPVVSQPVESLAEVGEAFRLGFSGTENLVMGDVAEIRKQEARAGLEDITATLDQVYPGQDNQARTQELAKMSQPDAEAKLRQDIEQGGQELQDRLTQQGIDSARLFDRLDAGLQELKAKKANQDAQAWANKMVQKVESDNPGRLPENQEKVARMINELPAQIGLNWFPGFRDIHNWAQLQRANYNQIKQDHPEWDERTIDARADAATGAQFPLQEFLSYLGMRGGPEIKAGIAGTVLRQGTSLATTMGVGALTTSATQVITNIESGEPPLRGVSDAAVSGAVFGGVLHAVPLTVAVLKRAFLATPQIRKAMGFSESVLAQDSAGMMRMVNGNGDSPAEKKIELNAIDMSLNGVKAVVDKATTQEEKESPVVEAFRKAEEARESGDLGEAQKQIDQALALATPTQRDEINRHVAAQLRVVTSTPPPTIAKPKETAPGIVPIEWKTLPLYQHKSDLPKGAETRVNTVTGETEYRVPPAKTEISNQPVIDYYGTNKAPKAEEKIKPPTLEQKEHKFPSGSIQTRADGQADLYLENGVVLTYPDVGDAIQARTTIRSARGHKWEARSSGETISQAELNNGQEVETAVPPKTEEQPPAVATEPVTTYQPELNPQGQPTGRQIAFRDGKRIGVVNPKASGETVDPVTPPATPPLEERLQRSIEQVGKTKGVQAWNIGDTVNVGFMKGLKVIRRIPTPGDYAPDQWLLQSKKGDYYLFTPHHGIQKLEEGMESLGALPDPAAFFKSMRAAKRWAAEKTGWQKRERWLREQLAPQRLGGESGRVDERGIPIPVAQDVAAMSIPLKTGAKTNLIQQIYRLAVEHNLNSVFNNAVESERREAFWNTKTDSQLRQWVIDWATKGETGNPQVDEFLRFTEDTTKFYTERATRSKLSNSWLANLFTHAFKDRNAVLRWYNEKIETEGRVPDFQEAIAAGARDPKLKLELRTYNPERLMLAHAASVMHGLTEIDMMEQMVDTDYAALKEPAVETEAERGGKKISVPAKVPYDWTDSFNAADGKTYMMSPEAGAVMKNAFGPSRLYDAIDMLPGHFFNAFKGLVSATLSWSQFHQLHMGLGIIPAEAITEHEMRIAKGLESLPVGAAKAVGSTIEGYWTIPVSTLRMFSSLFPLSPKFKDPLFDRMIPTVMRHHDLIDVMQGVDGADYDKLTLQSKRDYHDLQDMGVVVRPSHERYLQWVGWLAKQGQLGQAAGWPVKMGYKLLTNPGFGHWYFGRVLPTFKAAAALRRRDTVFDWYDRQGINLRDSSNAQIWRREAAKINRDIEGRFGEMLYDNLLWNQIAKAAGVKASLSLGWTLGFFRTFGDAAQDLSDNAFNMDLIAKGVYKNPELITNRMLFALNYAAASSAAALTASVVIGGVAISKLKWLDAVYPQLGTDDKGQPRRYTPPFWTTEAFRLYEGIRQHAQGNLLNVPMLIAGVMGEADQFLFNKATPLIHYLSGLFTNQDWRGRLIADPADSFWNNVIEEGKFFTQELLEPIGVQTLTTNQRVKDNKSKILALLGVQLAPTWVTRTPFENEVIYLARAEHPFGTIGHREADYIEKKGAYMAALESQEPRAIDEALKAWQGVQYGITENEIKDAQREVKLGGGKIDTALNMWKHLAIASQIYLLENAPREDFLKYFNVSSKQTRAQWVLKHGPLTPEQLAQTVPAQ